MLYDPDGTRPLTSTKRRSESDGPPPSQSSPVFPPPASGVAATDEHSITDDLAPTTALEFLTTPDMVLASETRQSDAGTITRHGTNVTSSTGTVAENGVYFGFVNMARPKSMLKCNGKESFKYCTIVSILFLLWGFSYGLLNTLNNVIAKVDHMTTAQTLGLTSAYFGGGYFFGPLLVGEWILRRDEHNRSKRHRRNDAEHIGGYKVTFIVGLCIYGIGTIIFWPSAVTNSYGGFMLSNFVVGFGLSVLEVGANSFMILCGPPDYGETRLMLAQGVQAVGSVISGLLAQKVFFTSLQGRSEADNLTLINVQWTYLGITLLCVALGLFFFYMPLPEVGDKELEDSAKLLPIDPTKKSVFGLQLRTVSIVLAVTAQYLYVATQESTSIFSGSLLNFYASKGTSNEQTTTTSGNSSGGSPDQAKGLALPIADYLLVAHAAFAVSRFLASIITYFSVTNRRLPKPRTLLTISVLLCFIFSIFFVVLRPSNPNLVFIPIALFFFAEGPIWPLIFAIGLRGQGRRTKRSAAFITMGGSGAAFFPFVMYGIMNTGGTVARAFIVIVALQIAMIAYSAFLDCVRDARLLVDPRAERRCSQSDEEKQTAPKPPAAVGQEYEVHSHDYAKNAG